MVTLYMEDEIIIAKFDDLEMDIEKAKRIVEDRKKLQVDGVPNPLLVHINSILSDSKVVRKFMANQGSEGISSAAFVVKNKSLEVLLKFFLAWDRPKIPINVFYNKEEAIVWLKSQR